MISASVCSTWYTCTKQTAFRKRNRRNHIRAAAPAHCSLLINHHLLASAAADRVPNPPYLRTQECDCCSYREVSLVNNSEKNAEGRLQHALGKTYQKIKTRTTRLGAFAPDFVFLGGGFKRPRVSAFGEAFLRRSRLETVLSYTSSKPESVQVFTSLDEIQFGAMHSGWSRTNSSPKPTFTSLDEIQSGARQR